MNRFEKRKLVKELRKIFSELQLLNFSGQHEQEKKDYFKKRLHTLQKLLKSEFPAVNMASKF